MKSAHQWRLEFFGAGDKWEDRIKAIQRDAISSALSSAVKTTITAEDLINLLTIEQRKEIALMLERSRVDLMGSNDEADDYYSHVIKLVTQTTNQPPVTTDES